MQASSTKIKICGLTSKVDLEYVIDLKIDFAGIILTEKSKRYISFDNAKKLLNDINKKDTALVAVLLNPQKDFVQKVISQLPFDYLQFHGNESAEFCEQFNFPYIKVFTVSELNQIKNYKTPYILIDSATKENRGGTGIVFDWKVLKTINKKNRKIFVAGGLNPENVLECIQQSHPYAIDISSGVEIKPGIKNLDKILQVVKKIRG